MKIEKKSQEESLENSFADEMWLADKDDKYGYKSLLLYSCSPERFLHSSEPEKSVIAGELCGYLKKTVWNDIYGLSKIRKRAKKDLGVNVDADELFSHLIEVFSPERNVRGNNVKQLKKYNAICETLTEYRYDIDRLESELYDIAKINLAVEEEEETQLENDPELGQVEHKVVEKSEETSGDDSSLKMEEEVLDEEKDGSTDEGEVASAKEDVEEMPDNDKGSLFGDGSGWIKSPSAKEEIKDEGNGQRTGERQDHSNVVGQALNAGSSLQTGSATNGVTPSAPKKQRMFSHPFSFKGRIRTGEYWLSLIIGYILYPVTIREFIYLASNLGNVYYFSYNLIMYMVGIFILTFVLCWFLLAQGTKRCHDMGCSGWYQLTGVWVIVMLFSESDKGANEYGD